MNILEILQNGEYVFADDALLSKKMKTLVETVNKNFADMLQASHNFQAYATSQLNGDVNRKIVMAKSLVEYYPDWQALRVAFDEVSKEESAQVAIYTNAKNTLLNNLRNLLKETQREPIVSLYDVFNGDFRRCEPGHEVVILGNHNTAIIETMLNAFETGLVVYGHFNEIAGRPLEANYNNVAQNVQMCRAQAAQLYGDKPGRVEKIEQTILNMEDVGKQVVFFTTYKQDMQLVGVKEKDLAKYETYFTKVYMPLKKALQKELRFTFLEICDIVVDEKDFNTADIDNPEAVQAYVEEPVAQPQPQVQPMPQQPQYQQAPQMAQPMPQQPMAQPVQPTIPQPTEPINIDDVDPNNQ